MGQKCPHDHPPPELEGRQKGPSELILLAQAYWKRDTERESARGEV